MSFTTTIPFSSTADGDTYFATRLYSAAWVNATTQNKTNALTQATNIINKFAYVGNKTVKTQANEWPRNYVLISNVLLDSAVVPNDIIIAQFEIAISLLQGIDPEKEIRGTRIVSRGLASVRATYDTHHISDHLLNGVPSAAAWDYLSPYFDRTSSGNVSLRRVS